jgi:O-antigen/teichoic acid export membrane protein
MGTLSSGISRFFSIANEKKDIGGYVKASLNLFLLAISITLVLGVFCICLLYFKGMIYWIEIIVLITFYSIFAGYNNALNSMQNAARQRPIVAIHNGLDAWFKIGFAVLLIISLGKNSMSVIGGYLVSSILISSSQTYHLKKLLDSKNIDYKESPKKNWSKEMWLYSWPFMLWGIFGWAQQSSTRWALEAFESTADVGRYAVIAQIGYFPIQTAITLLMTFLMPILYSRAGDATDQVRREGVDNVIKKVAMMGFCSTLLATLFTFVFHELIFEILVSENYRSISQYLPLMVLSGGIFGIALVISGRFFAFLSPSQMIPASIGSSIIGIISAFIGTYYFSVLGAVFAMLLHSLAFLILTLVTKINPIENK